MSDLIRILVTNNEEKSMDRSLPQLSVSRPFRIPPGDEKWNMKSTTLESTIDINFIKFQRPADFLSNFNVPSATSNRSFTSAHFNLIF